MSECEDPERREALVEQAVHVILCRNVLIYFGPTLQDEVNRLLHESLAMLGVLGLGRKESLKSTALERRYESLDPVERLYRKTM